jgi:RNA polymerase sigma-70 factor (ECF subfamily)
MERVFAMTGMTTSPSLLIRVRNPRDGDAWREFDRVYSGLIVRYCRGRGLSPTDAEDVRQIVLMNLAGALPKFEYSLERGRFRSYLGRVVRNAVFRRIRCPRPAVAALHEFEPAAITDPDVDHDATWRREWMHHHLRRAMQAIRRTHERRSLDVFERLLRGQPAAEVAEAMGMSIAAVHKVKQRVQRRLKAIVAMQLDEEDRL